MMTNFFIVAVTAAFMAAFAGCSGGDNGEASQVDAAVIDSGPIGPTFCSPTDGLGVADLRLEEVVSGLSLPVFVTAPPGDTRLFVLELPGRVRVIKDGELLATPFLDISSKVNDSELSQGLLGMTFHPDWRDNGKFYLSYTGISDGESIVEEYHVASVDADTAEDNGSTIITVNQEASNHNGGMIAFGPDGFLYLGLGDGANPNDPNDRGQDPFTHLGSMLRIDIDAPTAEQPYGIPADNPFADGEGGLPEVFAFGLRNPWRWSFDRATGDVYVADVGQRRVEEVSALSLSDLRGANFGWDVLEGSECFNEMNSVVPLDDCDRTGKVEPITQYRHTADYIPEPERVGDAITGGYVYRGSCLPSINGTYFYGDFVTNVVRTLEWSGGTAQNEADISDSLVMGGNNIAGLASFGEDGFGELYVVSHSGTVYRVVAP